MNTYCARIFFTFLLSTFSYGGCAACWKLHSVEIILTSDSTIHGYVFEHSEELKFRYSKMMKEYSFPEVIKHFTDDDYVSFIPSDSIGTVKYPLDSTLILLGAVQTIKAIDIDTVYSVKGSLSGREGASRIRKVTSKEFDLLNQKPFAMRNIDLGHSELYLLSYNPEIRSEGLAKYEKLNREHRKKGTLQEFIKTAKYDGIILFGISYD